MPPSGATPSWLKKADSSEYRTKAIRMLTQREGIRADFRNTSRQSNLPQSAESEYYSVATGAHKDNRQRNRYPDIFPYDRTRVAVDCGGVCGPEGRYLNASWVREMHGGKWWIAQQAPKDVTMHAFITMLLQPTAFPPEKLLSRPHAKPSDKSRVRTVVQLTPIVEGRYQSASAHSYFPTKADDEPHIFVPDEGLAAPRYKLSLVSSEELNEAHAVQSVVSIQPISSSGQDIGPASIFTHFFFTDWPDKGIPADSSLPGLMKFMHLVDESNRDVTTQPSDSRADLDPDPPIMVNCSAGVGRSGTFIALFSLFRDAGLIPPTTSILNDPSSPTPSLPPTLLGPLPSEYAEDKVVQEIDALREQRLFMVQTKAQAEMIYRVLKLAYEPNTIQAKSKKLKDVDHSTRVSDTTTA
ncbi:hypothetical protein EIP91_012101 [Steccherinum ochraceum]|uniref:Phosphatases II n=1 Tax=Steccherinum ochraceum TaxID=92696 RepID=A0A4R0RUE2_9APHY|nr:hypothetical protein EIP91_012101 [Steccherinum ochraceum]